MSAADPQPTTARPSNHLAYRPDIDGLRAVAILAVVAFHTLGPLVPGGFAGVDIFFVISGYLITGLLAREAEQSGDVKITEFYARRVRRILPALILVLLVTVAVGWVTLTAGELDRLASSSIASACFYVNHWFWQHAGYFAVPGEREPLLHLWSLSVEEQFYLVIPVFAAFVLWIGRPGGWRHRFGMCLVAAALGSFALSQFLLISGRTVAAFYLMPSRAWELAVGALLSVVSTSSLTRRFQWSRTCLGLIGVLFLLASCFGLNRHSLFPGLGALLPTFGTASLILAGEPASGQRSVVIRMLSARQAVWLGRMSYPWYLWHWPLLTLARVTRGPDDIRDVLLSLVALLLAAATYYFVERPIRRSAFHYLRPPTVVALGLATLVIMVGISRQIAVAARTSQREPAAWAVAEQDHPAEVGCHHDVASADLMTNVCLTVGPNSKDVTVVWGDSHANVWVPFVAEQAAGGGRGVLHATKTSCPPLLGQTPWVSDIGVYENCHAFNDRVLDEVRDLRGGGTRVSVLLATRWPAYLGENRISADDDAASAYFDATRRSRAAALAALRDGLDSTLSFLDRAGVRVAVMLPVPELKYPAPECLLRWRRSSAACSTSLVAEDAYVADASAIIRASARRATNTIVLDPASSLCDSARCYPSSEQAIWYSDDDHLSKTGAKFVGRSNGLLAWLDRL